MGNKMTVTAVNTFVLPELNDFVNFLMTLTTLEMLALIIVSHLQMTDNRTASLSNTNSFVSSEMTDKRTNWAFVNYFPKTF